MEKLNILMAYVSYPVTTAVYWERALRKIHNIKTIGPKLPAELITSWNLQNMKLPILDQEIPTDFTPDMQKLFPEIQNTFNSDIYLWVESVAGYFPTNLHTLKIPKVCYLIDSHLNLEWHVHWARLFDYVFIAQIEYIDAFKQAGNKNVYWLPLACDIDIHKKTTDQKLYDIGFVGSVFPGSRREKLLNILKTELNLHYERAFWLEMSDVFSKSKIVFNNAVNKDLNMRLFEVLSTGSFLLTDLAQNSAQDILFTDKKDYAIYNDDNILSIAKYYLQNESLREEIARNGQKKVHNAHQYIHRIIDMTNILIGNKKNTFSPYELKELSETNIVEKENMLDHKIPELKTNLPKASFVVPVLDYSPASEFNIKTLLEDLKDIEGEVIIIFNNEVVANEIKNHPRIDHYAIMKSNIGVARAWNVGLNISRTEYTFILNSDLKIGKNTVLSLIDALNKFKDAAVVGPQGSFFSFDLLKDYIYFDKGTFQKPIVVDAVSGFLFAVRTSLFNNFLLKFENDFTPCYFEEWDLGLQVKELGLKSYVIPSTDYIHHWSGSIKAYRKIKFYDQELTAKEIYDKNKEIFKRKWENKIKTNNKLQTGFIDFINNEFENTIDHNLERAIELLEIGLNYFPQEESFLINFAVALYTMGKKDDSIGVLKKVLEINPNNEIAKENLVILGQ